MQETTSQEPRGSGVDRTSREDNGRRTAHQNHVKVRNSSGGTGSMPPMNYVYIQERIFGENSTGRCSDKELLCGRLCIRERRKRGVSVMWVEWEPVTEGELTADSGDDDWTVITGHGRQASSSPERQSTLADFIKFEVNDIGGIYRYPCIRGKQKYEGLKFQLKSCSMEPKIFFPDYMSGKSTPFICHLRNYIHIVQDPIHNKRYKVIDEEPDALERSFNELHLFQDNSRDLVSKFIHDPYSTAMTGFSKVTNFLRDAMLVPADSIPESADIIAHMVQSTNAGASLSTDDDDGYTLISHAELPPAPEVNRQPPLTEKEWNTNFKDSRGHVINIDELKDRIFHGGISGDLRKEVWMFLLQVYPYDSTEAERHMIRQTRVADYHRLKLQWKTITAEQEECFSSFSSRRQLLKKDVDRTDRTHPAFEGDNNPNIAMLYNILMTYVMYNFDLGYVQGMSDLLAPILVTIEDEVSTFWCFVNIMERLGTNFSMEQEEMKMQLHQMYTLCMYVDRDFCSYLEQHDSGNMYFCFRWLLIMFKREFSFDDIVMLWEALWTNLPCRNFQLLFALAILDKKKTHIMHNQFGFTEILKLINGLSYNIDLTSTLCRAESIYLQLHGAHVKNPANIPSSIITMLGLDEYNS